MSWWDTRYLIFVAAVAGSWLVGFCLRALLFGVIHRWTSRTSWKGDDLILRASRTPFLLWCLLGGAYLGVHLAGFPRPALRITDHILMAGFILSGTVLVMTAATEFVKFYTQQWAGKVTIPTVTENVTRLAVLAVGTLIFLNSFGISIAPVLTALGVGGLAVALALQDTLANLFAGLYLSIARQIRVGDMVKLESGEEGNIADIGWRTTTMRTPANNLVIIPNTKLAQAIVTNYSLPDERVTLQIPVSVSYDADPELVERTLVDIATQAVDEIPPLLAQPAPTARFNPGVGAYSLDFTLICHVREFADQGEVQHALRKRILKRFRELGIEHPVPVRRVIGKG